MKPPSMVLEANDINGFKAATGSGSNKKKNYGNPGKGKKVQPSVLLYLIVHFSSPYYPDAITLRDTL